MDSNKNKILFIVGAIVLVVLAVILVNSFSGFEGDESSKDSSVEASKPDSSVADSSETVSDGTSETTSEESKTDSSEETSEESLSDSSEVSDSSSTASEPDDSSDDTSEPDDTSESSGSSAFDKSRKEGLYYQPNYITKDPNKKYVAFTFDDGPSQHTETLLNYLEEKDIVVTFFYVGNRLGDKYGQYVKRAVELGCEPAVHAYTHDNYYHNCSDSTYEYEVEKTADVIYKYAGCYPITMRPPGGSISAKRAEESDYNIIIWSVDSSDWKYSRESSSNVNTIASNILGDFESDPDCLNGRIVLLHDLYKNSVEAFMQVVDKLQAEGYEFVTVSQLLDLNATTTVGKQYYSMYYSK